MYGTIGHGLPSRQDGCYVKYTCLTCAGDPSRLFPTTQLRVCGACVPLQRALFLCTARAHTTRTNKAPVRTTWQGARPHNIVKLHKWNNVRKVHPCLNLQRTDAIALMYSTGHMPRSLWLTRRRSAPNQAIPNSKQRRPIQRGGAGCMPQQDRQHATIALLEV